MSADEIKVADPERMAYLNIIDKLLKLINPEKMVELERLEVDKSLAMIQQLDMYKQRNAQRELELAKAKQ
jgi:hypothetical protein